MAWLRTSDNAATHPLVMALATSRGSDDRTLNEVFGFVARCASQAAGHYTDYSFDLGTAMLLAGDRAELLLRQAVDAGLVTCHGRGKKRRWVIVEDPDLWHMRSREEVERDRRRREDVKDSALTLPVTLRDGDQCRYCGVVVIRGDQRGGRGRTYDHLDITQPTTVETYVVACRECNSRRGNTPISADERMQLLPPPAIPYFGRKTAAWLTNHGHPTQPSATEPGGGPRDPGTVPARPGDGQPRVRDTAHPRRPGPDQAGYREPSAPADGKGTPDPQRPDGEALADGHRLRPATAADAWDSGGCDPGRDTAGRQGQPPHDPGRDNAPTSSRPGDPAPDNAPTTWDLPPPGAEPGGGLSQSRVSPSESPVFRPGRVGSGRARVGPGGPRLPSGTDLANSPPARRRSRRGRRT